MWASIAIYIYICLCLSAVIPKKSVRFLGSVGCIRFFMGPCLLFVVWWSPGELPGVLGIFPVEFQLSLLAGEDVEAQNGCHLTKAR